MARVPLTGGAYQARSLLAAAQKCINLYPENNPEPASQAPVVTTHYLTPGLRFLGRPSDQPAVPDPIPVPPTPIAAQAWQAFAMSSTGVKMVGVANGGFVWTSADTGATWTQRTAPGSNIWNGCASSSDGAKLIICSGPGPGDPTGKVWISTDSGANWTEQTAVGLADWSSVACSADFTHLAAADFVNGFVWTSADSGANWTQRTTPGDHLFAMACSSDGLSLIVTNNNASATAYTSVDQGANWTTRTVSASQVFYAASSADGLTLYVSNTGAEVWKSTNGGAAWAQSGSSSAPDGEDGMACSSNGSVILAVGSQNVWVSTNSGGAWSNTLGPLGVASGAGASSTGAVMVTGDASTGLIWISTNSGAAWSSVNPTP